MSAFLLAAAVATLAVAYVLRPLFRPQLSASRACRVCGVRPEPDALFCSNCGRELGR